MRRVHPLVAAACAVAALTVAAERAAARVDVHVDFDETFDFATVKTWAWNPSEYGHVRMARTQTDDPTPMQAVAEPIIIDAVAAEFGKRGLRSSEASAAPPHITVMYYLLLTNSISAQTVGQFLPATTAWAVPPFVQSTQSLEIMNRGALVLDLSADGRVVWRGVAQANVKMDADRKKRESLIREAVRDLIRRYPPKPKKR